MDHNDRISPAEDVFRQPPGTVELLAHGHGAGDGQVTLIPTPSDDPNDPLRWPAWRKCLNYGLLVAMTTAIFTGLSIQTLFWTQMLEDMDKVTQQDLANAQAVQLVGLAIGCVFFIPFAKKYGRRTVYILTIAIAAVSSWWSASMNTVTELFLSNMLLGVAGATNQTAIAMSINDIFFVHQRGTANAMFFGAIMFGSFLTPMAAGVQGIADGWRTSYASLATAMTVLTVVFIGIFEETKFVPAVVRRPAKSVDDGDSIYKTDSLDAAAKASISVVELERGGAAPPKKGKFPRDMRLQLVTKTDESLWKLTYYPIYSWWFPHVLFTSIQLGSGICWLVVTLTMTSIVFSAPPYNFDAAGLGYMNAGPCVGSVFGALYGGYFVDKAIVWFSKRNGGWFEPEMRLWLYPLPAVAMSAGLIIFGVSADRGAHFVIPSIGGALFAFAFGSVSDIATALVLDSFPDIVPQTFVAITFLRNAISMAGPFSVTPWLDHMSVTGMFILAGCISLGVNLLALPLVIWGKRARAAVAPRYYRLSSQGL
ncbi:hypothetical protein CDD83_7318 [Cordyceps sp. RAO-2017]|nr:hypothetical protein CDD83_7318 [Cordyceps sp. RAO-2017]